MGAPKDRDGRPVIDVYARISRMANGDVIKVDDQVEVCEEDIARRGGVVGEAFRDPSLSAWNPRVVRPDWDKLMRRLESGESDGVAGGARVWSHAGEYDLTTADGRRHFREAMVAAVAESDKISERVTRGKARKADPASCASRRRTSGMRRERRLDAGYHPRLPCVTALTLVA